MKYLFYVTVLWLELGGSFVSRQANINIFLYLLVVLKILIYTKFQNYPGLLVNQV